MKYGKTLAFTAMLIAAGFASTASAASIGTEVSGNASGQITTDQHWTQAGSPYFLKEPVKFVGADLTIDAGVIVITLSTDDGGIVITRGSQIFVNGTADEPVIMTSAEDVATWSGSAVVPANFDQGTPSLSDDVDITDITAVGDPKTGTWRPAVQEWRNLTILGEGVISASDYDGLPRQGDDGTNNPAFPGGDGGDGGNTYATARMEGLDSSDGTPAEIFYGGTDDDYDAGTIRYLSMRYTGRVVGFNDELNGFSVGAAGRNTDFQYIDLMNNVDDGIETWGGTVSYKYVNIWNMGDDSFDFDQGWRGKAQFGLIVQGYATGGPNSRPTLEGGKAISQGSGTSDNIFEGDGAEDSDAQPRTTSVVYNFTVIGEPNSGDGATVWRDNKRVQYRNMLFMDIGEELVRWDDVDGDGAQGYGLNGTHSFTAVWTTDYDVLPTVNAPTAHVTTADLYWTQVDGKLAEITDSVMYNLSGDSNDAAFTSGASNDPDGVGPKTDANVAVLEGTAGSPQSSATKNNIVVSTLPVRTLVRAAGVNAGGKTWENVSSLDPRPAIAAAQQSVSTAPADGFFTPAPYRGAFSAEKNWALGWTAADAYGFFTDNGDANPSDPTETISLAAKINFPTEDGVTYTVFESTDGGQTYQAIGTIVGDGSTKSVADLEDFDDSKLYKVEVQ